ncbi:MAG TPA: metallophosphoesterase family protein, partial [Candidatus Polarisedimenticolaceae bacterium]|nr:metallophosphoesterase family protein [Candidatus Polarisedimenticolaceae bacterium]
MTHERERRERKAIPRIGRQWVRRAVCGLFLLLSRHVVPAAEVALFEFGSANRYLANSSDPGVGLAWTQPGFDDSIWQQGTYGIGYDDAGSALALLQTQVPSGVMSVYTRTTFQITETELAEVSQLTLGVDYDDGFVAWLNGVEIWKASLPSNPAWDTPASATESSNGTQPSYRRFDVTRNIPQLQVGTNVLAVGVWNTHTGSSDLVLAPAMWKNADAALIRGPYLQSGSPTSIVVRWRTNGATPSRVLYGPSAGSLAQVVEDPTAVEDHEITLTGLDPDTTYYYAVGTDSEILAGDDAQHFFVTAPLSGTAKPTRIWVLGDSGTGDANATAVRDAYYAYTGERHTDLWLMLGDNAYDDGTDLEFQTKLFDIYPEMLRKSVLWPTLGNHDGVTADSATQTGPYYDIFTLPKGGEAGGVASGTEAYYSFDYGNVHFIVLDSFETSRTLLSPMRIWLEQDLAATTQDWIIAFWHHPPYSKGSHDSDTEYQQVDMRQNFVPLLDEYGVDLTLTGHSHSYERSYPIVGHYGTSDTFDESMKTDPGDGREDGGGPYQKPALGPNPHSGIVHTVAGNGGRLSSGTFDHPAMFLSLMELGSLIIDVNQTRLDLRLLDRNGAILDYLTVFKGPIVVAPVADFDATPPSGNVPLLVDF